MKLQLKHRLIFILIIICLMTILIIQNAAMVEIRIFFWSILISRVILILLLLIVGIIIGWLLKGLSIRSKIFKKK